MRIRVPITGTVKDFNPDEFARDGIGVYGDDGDPIRVDVDLGHVSWRLVSIDLENDEAEIEVAPDGMVVELRPGANPASPKPDEIVARPATEAEKLAKLAEASARAEHARNDPSRRRLRKLPEHVRSFQQVKHLRPRWR